MTQSMSTAHEIARAVRVIARAKYHEYTYWQPPCHRTPFEHDPEAQVMVREHEGYPNYPLPCPTCSTYAEQGDISFQLLMRARLIFERDGKLYQLYHLYPCQHPETSAMIHPKVTQESIQFFLDIENTGGAALSLAADIMRPIGRVVVVVVCVGAMAVWAFAQ